jgi:hypothetical protein
MIFNIIKRYACVKIVALYLVGILLIVITTTTSPANSIITNGGLFPNSEAQLANNSNNNADVSLVSQRAYSDASLFHIVEVQNTGRETVQYVQVIAL